MTQLSEIICFLLEIKKIRDCRTRSIFKMTCPEASNVICYDLTPSILKIVSRNRRAVAEFNTIFSNIYTDCRTWSILKTSSGYRGLSQCSFLSKHEFNLKL